MPVPYADQPADSSELEPFRGYAVADRPEVASGGPPRPRGSISPGDPLDGIVLIPSRRPTAAAPIDWHRGPEPRAVRRSPWRSRSIIGNGYVGALLLVPALSCLLVVGLERLLR